MARRVGMAELAAEAGVSVATVDRALNGREPVSETLRERIAAAAVRIGHHAAQRLQRESRAPTIRFGLVLHKKGQDFYKAFAAHLERAVREVSGVDGRLVLEFSASQAPSDMAPLLRSMAGRCDVLAATAVNHPEVTAAVEELGAAGVKVFCLLSEFAQDHRVGYLGLDNLKVGRTAGWVTALSLRGRVTPGKALVVIGGNRWHGHELREAGFRSYLREAAPDLAFLDTFVNLETRQLTYEATHARLSRHPDLRAIYLAGGGMEGAVAALREARSPGEVVLVVSALTPESRRGLAEGVVTMAIDTPLAALCRELFARMARVVLQPGMPLEHPQLFLPPELHVTESI